MLRYSNWSNNKDGEQRRAFIFKIAKVSCLLWGGLFIYLFCVCVKGSWWHCVIFRASSEELWHFNIIDSFFKKANTVKMYYVIKWLQMSWVLKHIQKHSSEILLQLLSVFPQKSSKHIFRVIFVAGMPEQAFLSFKENLFKLYVCWKGGNCSQPEGEKQIPEWVAYLLLQGALCWGQITAKLICILQLVYFNSPVVCNCFQTGTIPILEE